MLSVVLLVACCAVLWANAQMSPGFRVDDSYIVFRYSENLASGAGLVFNPGERVEGISTPLWAVLLAVFAAADADLAEVARWLSQLSAFGCLCLVFSAVGRATGSRSAAGFAALLLAVHMGFAMWIRPGLETLFLAFLLLLT